MWLADAGLYHYKNRVYHPGLGRFTQTDPIGVTGGINLYAYVGNDPITFTDPLGLCTGSRIKNKNGTCKSTGGYTTGSNGVMQGVQIERSAREAAALYEGIANIIRNIDPENLEAGGDLWILYKTLSRVFNMENDLTKNQLEQLADQLDIFAEGLYGYITRGDMTVCICERREWPRHLDAEGDGFAQVGALTDPVTSTIYIPPGFNGENLVYYIFQEAIHLYGAGNLLDVTTGYPGCRGPTFCATIQSGNSWHAFFGWYWMRNR